MKNISYESYKNDDIIQPFDVNSIQLLESDCVLIAKMCGIVRNDYRKWYNY